MEDFKAGDKVRLKKDAPVDEMRGISIPLVEIEAVRKSNYVIIEKSNPNYTIKIRSLTQKSGFYWNKEWFEYYSFLPEELFKMEE